MHQSTRAPVILNIMKELKLIQDIRKMAGKPAKGVKRGIGDDCAVLEYDKKKYLLWATDMLVKDTHFRKNDDLRAVGYKAVAVNVSDIAAMGGIPKYITVSLGLTKRVSSAAVKKLYSGILSICRRYDIALVGGDTVRSSKSTIDISIIGFVEKKKLLLRSGAKKGDLVLVTGPVRDGRKEHLSFTPRIKESRFLVENYNVNSMIDTSDGLAIDLGRICSESDKGCILYEEAIPLSKGLKVKDALYYGESFELLFTMKKKEVEKLFTDKNLKKSCPYYVIGEMTDKREGLKIIKSGGVASRLKMEGFSHL